jgi:hypothetical protein
MSSDDTKEILEQLAAINSDVTTIKEAILGKINEERPGLLERVRRIEEWIKAREWFERLIIGTVLAEIIGILFLTIKMMAIK